MTARGDVPMMRIIEQRDLAGMGLAGKDVIVACGMPGIGTVGKMVVEAIRDHFKAEPVVTIFYDDFPSQVIVEAGGTLVLPSVQLLHASVSGKVSLLLVTGDFQPTSNTGVYNFMEKFWEFLERKGMVVSMLVSTGAYVPEHIPTRPKIYVAGTSKDAVATFVDIDPGVVQVMDGGIITGANGIFPAWGSIVGVPGICLLAETIPMVKKDPKAAKILIELLGNRFGFTANVSELQAMADEMDSTIEELKKRAGIMPDDKLDDVDRGSQSYIG